MGILALFAILSSCMAPPVFSRYLDRANEEKSTWVGIVCEMCHCGGSHRVDMFGKGKGGKGGKGGGKGKGNDGPPLDLDVFQEAVDASVAVIQGPGPATTRSFDDALHNVLTTPRPVDAAEVQAFCASIASLILAAGDSAENWKLLTLAMTQRRFHTRAPAAAPGSERSAVPREGRGRHQKGVAYTFSRDDVVGDARNHNGDGHDGARCESTEATNTH